MEREMSKEKTNFTRRDFLRAGSLAALGAGLGVAAGRGPAASAKVQAATNTAAGAKSRVILVREPGVVLGDGSLDPGRLAGMLDEAMRALYDVRDARDAWRQVAGEPDVVGFKSNVWTPLPTPPALVDAVRERLLAVGVKAGNFAADDRGVLRNPVFQKATALVNARPMRSHHWAGLGTLIKNYIMFVPDPSAYHPNSCENLGSIWHKPVVAGKTRLNILVMLTPQFHGVGPHSFSQQYVWTYGGLIISRDPVAADATGARIIQARRREYFKEDRPISPPPLHIAAADSKFGLGQSRPERIDLRLLGSREGLLIEA
jgi:hypothetical protein